MTRIGRKILIAAGSLLSLGVIGAATQTPGPTPSSTPTPPVVLSAQSTATPTPTPIVTPAPTRAPTLTPTVAAAQTSTGSGYINSDGNYVQSPVHADAPPAGATAQCGDGSYSFSQHRSGTCSHHGGVARWL